MFVSVDFYALKNLHLIVTNETAITMQGTDSSISTGFKHTVFFSLFSALPSFQNLSGAFEMGAKAKTPGN